MQLAVDSELLLASLALSPPHAHDGHMRLFSQDEQDDARADATPSAGSGDSPDSAAPSRSPADAAVAQPDSNDPASASRHYHAHVLHEIAVAATPRHSRAVAAATGDSTADAAAAVAAASAQPVTPASPGDDMFDFHLSDADLRLEELGSSDSPQHRQQAQGLPLAHLTAQPQRRATPADMLAILAEEVDDEDTSAEGHAESARDPNRRGDAEESGSRLPSHLDTSSSTPKNGSFAAPSPSYIMSPATHAQFREHMNQTYDIQLSPLPANESSDAAAGKEAESSTSDNQPSEAETARNVLLRQRIIEELLSSERSYLASLEKLVTYFVEPLRISLTPGSSLFQNLHVSKAQQETLFGPVELIVQFNRRLCDELEQAVCHPPADQTAAEWFGQGGPAIGAMFGQFAPFFRMYNSYVSNHEASATLLATLEKGNKEFATFCSRQGQVCGSTLQSLLIGPIQRVPRYSLLLQELLRKTTASHPDFAALSRSLSLVNHAASHINESVRAAQNRAQLLALQERFSGDLVLLAPGRWFVRQGALTKQGRHSDVEYQFFLFNNLILYASTTPLGNLRLHRSIPLDASFHFARLPDDDAVTPTAPITSPPSQQGALSLSEIAAAQDPSSAIGSSVRSPSSTLVAAAHVGSSLAGASDSSPAKPNRFLIESRERSFVVYAKTAALKKEWLADLQAVTMQIRLHESQRNENVALALAASAGDVDAQGHSRSVSRSNSISLPADLLSSGGLSSFHFGRAQPVMEQVKATSACVVCSRACSSFSGRRHCQSCGHIACSRCCRTELFLEWTRRESRVCDRCVDCFKAHKVQQHAARRGSLDGQMPAQGIALPPGPAPPIPARPSHAPHPQRPRRPSKDSVNVLLSHSRHSSMDHNSQLTPVTDEPTDAASELAAAGGAASKSKAPRPSLQSDVNSDDEPEDLAGVKTPKPLVGIQV